MRRPRAKTPRLGSMRTPSRRSSGHYVRSRSPASCKFQNGCIPPGRMETISRPRARESELLEGETHRLSFHRHLPCHPATICIMHARSPFWSTADNDKRSLGLEPWFFQKQGCIPVRLWNKGFRPALRLAVQEVVL